MPVTRNLTVLDCDPHTNYASIWIPTTALVLTLHVPLPSSYPACAIRRLYTGSSMPTLTLISMYHALISNVAMSIHCAHVYTLWPCQCNVPMSMDAPLLAGTPYSVASSGGIHAPAGGINLSPSPSLSLRPCLLIVPVHKPESVPGPNQNNREALQCWESTVGQAK